MKDECYRRPPGPGEWKQGFFLCFCIPVVLALFLSVVFCERGMTMNNRFVIVAVSTFQVETKAYFANTRAEAEKRKQEAEALHGGEFKVYRR